MKETHKKKNDSPLCFPIFQELSPRSEDTDLSPCSSHPVTWDYLLTMPLSVLNSVNVWLRNSWKFCKLYSCVDGEYQPHWWQLVCNDLCKIVKQAYFPERLTLLSLKKHKGWQKIMHDFNWKCVNKPVWKWWHFPSILKQISYSYSLVSLCSILSGHV